jgi:hypothetical protein
MTRCESSFPPPFTGEVLSVAKRRGNNRVKYPPSVLHCFAVQSTSPVNGGGKELA